MDFDSFPCWQSVWGQKKTMRQTCAKRRVWFSWMKRIVKLRKKGWLQPLLSISLKFPGPKRRLWWIINRNLKKIYIFLLPKRLLDLMKIQSLNSLGVKSFFAISLPASYWFQAETAAWMKLSQPWLFGHLLLIFSQFG